MNYEDMSKEQLNGRLTSAIYGKETESWCLSDCGKFAYDCGPIGESYHEIELMDYCADWNATMLLAVEYGVSILHCGGDDFEISYEYHAPVGKFGTDEILTWHINAKKESVLRAIVICIIKVLENKDK